MGVTLADGAAPIGVQGIVLVTTAGCGTGLGNPEGSRPSLGGTLGSWREALVPGLVGFGTTGYSMRSAPEIGTL